MKGRSGGAEKKTLIFWPHQDTLEKQNENEMLITLLKFSDLKNYNNKKYSKFSKVNIKWQWKTRVQQIN